MRRLVIRPGAIGDCILAMPAIQQLAADYTELWLPGTLVPLFKKSADVVRSLSSTGIDLVGIGDLQMPAALKDQLQTFDSVVSWYGANRPEFRETMLGTGVPCEFHRALPPPEYGGHATDFFLEQVGAAPGAIPRIKVALAPKRQTVVIHPFSGSQRKNWPLECYRELAAKLPYSVEWSAGPEEELPEATRFSDLYDLAEWIAVAELYIGNDSGITHLAAATGVATLALFGPTSPETWAPRGRNVEVLLMQQLTVDAVLSAANRLLGLQ
jgi:heptosyltransferase-3